MGELPPRGPATPRAGPWVPWRTRLRNSSATVGLIVVCVVAFAVTLALCGSERGDVAATIAGALWRLQGCPQALIDQGALALGRLWIDGEWWRLLSTTFLHGSWIHLVLNAWSLWVVGEWVEHAWGSWRLIAMFLASSVAGCLTSVAWCEAGIVVGASAGVIGLAGALFIARTRGEPELKKRLQPVSAPVLGAFLLVLVGLGFVVDVIAQAGHLGGLACGLLLGWTVSAPAGARAQSTMGIATIGLGAAALAAMAARPDGRVNCEEFQGYRLLELGRSGPALVSLERVLADRANDANLSNTVAYALAEAGADLPRALDLVELALEAEPNNPDFLDTLGWIHCRAGRVAEGLAALERAEQAASREIPEIALHIAQCASPAGPSE